MRKRNKWESNIVCDNCKYQNHEKYVRFSGVCHLCGKVLDEKAYFKQQMNKKLHLWKNERINKWN